MPPPPPLCNESPAGLASLSSGYTAGMTTALDGLPLPELARHLDDLGVGARHAPRVFKGIHRDHLPLSEIQGLGRHATTIATHLQPTQATLVRVYDNPDETRKLLISLHDGAQVEAVLVPMRHDRYTLCLSSQVGCAMACAFCATGTLGLTRNLSAGEIVAQVRLAQDLVASEARTISRLVFMGMGEPLAAYDSLLSAIRIFLDPHGLCLAAKNLTVSTVGLVPRMHALARDTRGRIQLALSLHAGTDATRAQIIPVAKRWPIAELRQALLDWPLPGSRALMVEVVVLPGINDDDANLDGLAAFMQGLRGVVNLIPFNPFPGSTFRTPTQAETLAMRDGLKERGVLAKVRWPRGRGVSGACGQLMLAEAQVPGSTTSASAT